MKEEIIEAAWGWLKRTGTVVRKDELAHYANILGINPDTPLFVTTLHAYHVLVSAGEIDKHLLFNFATVDYASKSSPSNGDVAISSEGLFCLSFGKWKRIK